MDPNTALADLRRAVEMFRAGTAAGMDRDTLADHAGDILEGFAALDEWLSHGGFLPTPWAAGR